MNKISNILEFENINILQHYKDDSDKNWLYYYIQYNEENDTIRSLKWTIYDKVLYSYLKGEISLLKLVQSATEGEYYIADIFYNDEIFEQVQIKYSLIPKQYLPDNDAYYSYDFPKEYINYNK